MHLDIGTEPMKEWRDVTLLTPATMKEDERVVLIKAAVFRCHMMLSDI